MVKPLRDSRVGKERREGEWGALCHVQAGTEYPVSYTVGAEKIEEENKMNMCSICTGLREKSLRGRKHQVVLHLTG